MYQIEVGPFATFALRSQWARKMYVNQRNQQLQYDRLRREREAASEGLACRLEQRLLPEAEAAPHSCQGGDGALVGVGGGAGMGWVRSGGTSTGLRQRRKSC